MKFPHEPKAYPAEGSKRIVRRFLFLPKRLTLPIGGMEWRWLEWAYVEQVYETRMMMGCDKLDEGTGWFDNRWCDDGRKS